MVRDIRYIFKKVLIGLLIAIGIMFIKFKGVFALDTIPATSLTYFQTQNCDNGTTVSTNTKGYNCTKGATFRFPQVLNYNNNLSYPMPITAGTLINDMTFKIDITDPVTITSTNRYLTLRAPFITQAGGSSDKYVSILGLTLNGIRNDNVIFRSPGVSSFAIRPNYCKWTDNNGVVSYCNLVYSMESSTNRVLVYIDIPLGSVVSSVSLYFGNQYIQSYYETIFTTTVGFQMLTNDSYGKHLTGATDSFYVYAISWTDLKNHFNDNSSIGTMLNYNVGAGILHYYYAPQSPTYTLSNLTENFYWSTSYNSNNYIYFSFNNVPDTLTQYYNNLVSNMDIELDGSNEEQDVPEWLEDTFGDFNGTYANNFTSLFSSLFAYPISKMNQQLTFDLTNYNTWTQQKVIDSKVCWGTDSILGDVLPNYKVHFFRDYTFSLPCPHNDIYRHLGYGDYGFYPPNFQDSVEPGYSYSFATLWLTIQHGVLVYLLFVNCLNIYKYILDSNKSDVEVLEL